jgi:hypothetical protein
MNASAVLDEATFRTVVGAAPLVSIDLVVRRARYSQDWCMTRS